MKDITFKFMGHSYMLWVQRLDDNGAPSGTFMRASTADLEAAGYVKADQPAPTETGSACECAWGDRPGPGHTRRCPRNPLCRTWLTLNYHCNLPKGHDGDCGHVLPEAEPQGAPLCERCGGSGHSTTKPELPGGDKRWPEHDPLLVAEQRLLSCGPDEPGSSEAQREAIMALIDAIRERTDPPSSVGLATRADVLSIVAKMARKAAHRGYLRDDGQNALHALSEAAEAALEAK